MTRIISAFLLLIVTALPTTSTAGSNAADNPILPAAQVASFSNRVQQDLASRGVHAVSYTHLTLPTIYSV